MTTAFMLKGGHGLEPEHGEIFNVDEDWHEDELIDGDAISFELAAMDEECRREIAEDFCLPLNTGRAKVAAKMDEFDRFYLDAA